MARIRGTGKKDSLFGTLFNDLITGLAGNDRIVARAGNDSVSGGLGNDSIDGGVGNDRLRGDAGNDLLKGQRGNDSLAGGIGNDRALGGAGADQLTGDAGNDFLYGDADNDTLAGGTGTDFLSGGAGDDALAGGAGNDSIYGGTGTNDRAIFSGLQADYTITAVAGGVEVSHLGGAGADGTDFVSSDVELLVFAGDVSVANPPPSLTNAPPTVVNDTAAATEDVMPFVSGNVLDNDSDADGDTLVATPGTFVGTYGTLVLQANGGFTYVLGLTAQALSGGEIANEIFAYTASDGTDATPGLLTITITGTNDVPVITGAVTGGVLEDGTTATGSLSIADVDTGESTFVAQAGTTGTYGTFGVTTAGAWTYTINNGLPAVQALKAGQTVTETFTVVSADLTASQTVTVTLTGVNDTAAITGTATGAVGEDGTLTTGGTLTVADADTGEAQVVAQAATAGAYGTFAINTAGVWSYALNNDDGAVQALKAGQSVTDSFVVTSADGTDSETVTITITGTNDVPVITGAVTGGVLEDGTTATGSLSIADVDTGESTFVAQAGTTGTYGTFGVTTAGAWTYTINNGLPAVQALKAGQTVTETFTVVSADLTASQTVTVTLTGVNDTAAITGTATGAVGEDGTLTTGGTLTVADADTGEAQVVAQAATAGAYGTFAINTAGVWSYALNNDDGAVQALKAGQSVTDSFVVTSADGTDSETVTITITGTNDVPVITGAVTGGVLEDGTTATGSLSIADVDTGESTFVAQAGTTGTYGTFGVTTAGAWTYTINNGLPAVQALKAGQTVTETFTVVSADLTASQTVTVTLTGVNDTAAITGTATGAVGEDGTLTTGGTLTVADADTGEAQVVAQAATAGAYGTFAINTAGVWSYALNNDDGAVQALKAGQSVTDSFVVTSADGTDSETVTITITGTNDVPVVSAFTTIVGEDAAPATIIFSATDVDGDSLTFSLVSGLSAPIGTLGPIVGNTVSFTPGAATQALATGETATATFTIKAYDGAADSATQTITVTVTGENDAPILTVAPAVLTQTSGALGIAVAGPAGTTLVDAEARVTSISLTLTAVLGGLDTPAEGLSLTPAFASTLISLGFTVTGNGTGLLTVTGPAAGVAPGFVEAILESVTYADGDTSFGFNPLDRSVSITVTDHQGMTSTQTVTIDMAANVVDTGGLDIFVGSNLADTINGDTGSDTLTGGGGNDSLIGGDYVGTTDTAVYSGASTEYTVTVAEDATTGFVTGFSQVADSVGGRDGTDALTGIERLDFTDMDLELTNAVQLFSADPAGLGTGTLLGTFSTIAGAVAAAAPGQVILVNGAGGVPGAPVYSGGPEDITLTEGITLRGLGTVSVASLTISGGGAGHAIDVDNIDVTATTATAAVAVTAGSVFNSITFQNGDVSGGTYAGLQVIDAPSVLAVTVANAAFTGNATVENGSGESAIQFYHYNNVVTLTNVSVSAPGAIAENGIAFVGSGSPGSASGPMGTVTLSGVTVTGTFAKTGVAIYDYTNISGLTFAGPDPAGALSINVTAAFAGLNIDGIGGNVDLGTPAGLQVVNAHLIASDISVQARPGTGVNIFVGDASDDTLIGYDGADTLTGGGGADTIWAGTSADTVNAGDGNDNIIYAVGDGGAGETIDGGNNTDALLIIDTAAADDTVSVVVNGSGVITTLDGGSVSNVELVTAAVDNTIGSGGTLPTQGGGAGSDTLSYAGTTAIGVTVDLTAGTATGFASNPVVAFINPALNKAIQGFENVTGGSGADSLTGTAGANTLAGGGGFDTLTGGVGIDTLQGGETGETYTGATGEGDRAFYASAITSANVTLNGGTGGWTVAAIDGSDELTGIELVQGTAGNFLLVGNGGFDSIAAALAEAQSGDTILVKAGSYDEGNLAVDKDVAIVAVGGTVTLTVNGTDEVGFIVTGDGIAGGAVTISGFSIVGSNGAEMGILYSGNLAGTVNPLSTLSIVDTSVSGFDQAGVLVTGGGAGLDVNITNGTFTGNGGAATSGGSGEITFFEFRGNATLNGVIATGTTGTSLGSADHGIAFSGFEDSDDSVDGPIGAVSLSNVTVSGNYEKTLLFVQGYNDLSTLSFSGVTLGNAGTPSQTTWTALYITEGPVGVGYTPDAATAINVSGVNIAGWTYAGLPLSNFGLIAAQGAQSLLVGSPLGADFITGTAGNDAIIGSLGNDTINSGAGNDLVFHYVGDGQDSVDMGEFGGDDDQLIVLNYSAVTNTPNGTAQNFTVGVNAGAIEVNYGVAAGAEITANGVEDITIYLGTGGDTVTILTPLGGTTLSTSTIVVDGTAATTNGQTVNAGLINSDLAVGVTFMGGGGNDTFVSGAGADVFDGNGGVDTVSYAASTGSVIVDLSNLVGSNVSGADGADTLTDVENVVGSAFADTIAGNGGSNVITTGGGSDTVSGGGGSDTVIVTGDVADFTVTIDPVTGKITLTGDGPQAGVVIQIGGPTAQDVEILTFSAAPGVTYDLTKSVVLINADGNFVNTFDTIQAAVDAAISGNTVRIGSGTYNEQVVVNGKDLTITGDGDATIITLPTTVTTQNFAAGNRASVITVTNAIVTISDVLVDGAGRGSDAITAGAIDFHGIAYINAGGVVDDVTVTGIRQPLDIDGHVSGVQQGRGIYANNVDGSSRSLTVTDNTVQDFQKNGIDLRGTGLTVSVSGSDVTGEGATPTIAQNGIVVVGGVAGTISGNTVEDVGYVDTPANAAATSAGILNFNSNVSITGNTITAPSDAITLPDVLSAAGAYSTGDTTGATINGNTISNFPTAIISDSDGATPVISGNILTGNAVNISLESPLAPMNFTASAGVDYLEGSSGNDTFTGGAGVDTLIGFGGIDSAVYGPGATISIVAGKWTVTSGGDADALTGIEKVVIGSTTYLLVDKTGANVGGFQTLQSAIDAATGGESILVAPGTYDESANYNPADNTNSGTNPLGLLVNKSVTIQGVAANGQPITDAGAVVATIQSTVESNWGTNFFVTAPDVTIVGLSLQAFSVPWGEVNKVVEVVEDNFTLQHSVVGAATGLEIGATIYINDDTVALPFTSHVSDISSVHIIDNTLKGDVVIANGAGYGVASPDLEIKDNDFILNPGSDTNYNWGIIITGEMSGVPWRLAPVALPEVTGNSFAADYTTDRLLYVRDDDPLNFPSRTYVTDFLANNSIGTYAFATQTVGGALRLFDIDDPGNPYGTGPIDSNGFAVYLGAGAASAAALTGDTLVVRADANPATATIVTNNLRIDAQAGTSNLDLTLGGGVITLTLLGNQNVDVLGNAGANVIIGNAGANNLQGDAGDDTITGGGGVDTIHGGTGDIDTAVYPDAATVTWDALASKWQVTSAADGAELLTDIEAVDLGGAGGSRILLVDQTASGGFATIQDAVNAASAGDTILIAPGTYSGAGNVNVVIDKALTIQGTGKGSGAGDTIINAAGASYGFRVDLAANALTSTVTIKGLAVINAQGNGIEASEQQVLGTLVVDNVRVEDSINSGLFVTGRVPSSAYTQAGVQTVVVTNSNFVDNGQSASNSANLFLYEFDGNATLTNLTVSNGVSGLSSAAYGVQISGVDGPLYDQTLFPGSGQTYDVLTPIGTVTLTGVSITGEYRKPGLYVQGYTNTAGLTFGAGNVVNANSTVFGKPIIIDPMADQLPSGTPGTPANGGSFFDDAAANGSYDLSGIAVTATGSDFNELDGTTKGDTITGTNIADQITGFAGNDILNGGAGGDIIIGGAGTDNLSGGSGNDVFLVGASADHAGSEVILGGADSDVIRFTSTTALELLTLTSGVTGVEEVEISDAAGGNAGIVALNVNASALGAGILITGNDGTNVLTGSNFTDVIRGNGGTDTLSGFDGSDTLEGGAGVDDLTGGAGIDHLYGGTGFDTLEGGTDGDFYYFLPDDGLTTAGADTIEGFNTSDGLSGDKLAFDDTGVFSGLSIGFQFTTASVALDFSYTTAGAGAHFILDGQSLWYDNAGDGFADFKIAVFDNTSVLSGIAADIVII